MTIVMSGKNFDLTEAIKAHITDAVRSRFDSYEGIIVQATVLCEAHHEPHRTQSPARVQLDLELPGPDIVVEKEGDDLYELVNVVCGVAFDQLSKRKEKGEL